ncbi:MAG TPA: HAD-IA family hydrolase, partial [Erysipelothrix sp.]|nr:HAD-IA family hydrolase [Erysipelothrix sp.]
NVNPKDYHSIKKLSPLWEFFNKNDINSNTTKDTGRLVHKFRAGQQVVTKALEQNKIDQVFDVIVNGDMVKTKKPAPDIYELMVSKLGIKPHQCLAVEDTEVGILSAKLAGCDVVFKRNQRYAVNHQTADYVIDHLAELLEILK